MTPATRALDDGPHVVYAVGREGDVHEYELHDLTTGPHQLDDALSTPEGVAANEALAAALQARLDTLVGCAGPTCR